MCGIAGLWTTSDINVEMQVRAMINALHHRGPDTSDTCVTSGDYLVLGHARLSIVDLSENGRQPMLSHSGRYTIVLNGEIYNHLDIKAGLDDKISWRGHSDTEIFLAAVDAWGFEEALRRSVGMFAVGLWDRQDRTLSLARDRIGEKPLYVGRVPGGLAFASEIKALRQCRGIDLSLDQAALTEYMRVGYVPGTQTAYACIRKIAPGGIFTYTAPTVSPKVSAYWSLPPPSGHDMLAGNDVEMINEFEGLLERSVSEQMLADVPVGAFLSGGIDSSLIVTMMQRVSKRPVRTFTMGFAGRDRDETGHARQVAAHLGTDHTELMVEPDDVLKIVPRIAEIYDEPFADSSQIPTVLLSQLIRQHVTVALSGDAGDELFCGYNRYLAADKLMPILTHLPLALRKKISSVLRSVPSDAWDACSAHALPGHLLRLPRELGEKVSRIAGFLESRDIRSAYSSTITQWRSDADAPVNDPLKELALPECAHPSVSQCMMWWDMQTYLPDDILVKVDRAAMSASLETRLPLLDYRIVEFALRTPMQFKLRKGQSKWLLRALLGKYLPLTLFKRPKQGFSLPIGNWLRGPLREWAESLLEPSLIGKSGLLNEVRVRKIWQEHCQGIANHQKGLWTILMLQGWLLNSNAANR